MYQLLPRMALAVMVAMAFRAILTAKPEFQQRILRAGHPERTIQSGRPAIRADDDLIEPQNSKTRTRR